MRVIWIDENKYNIIWNATMCQFTLQCKRIWFSMSVPVCYPKMSVYITKTVSVYIIMQKDMIVHVSTSLLPILPQVMACSLAAPSHYQVHCWLIINSVLWHSHEGNLTWLLQMAVYDILFHLFVFDSLTFVETIYQRHLLLHTKLSGL